jgi:hypothetical protein
LLFYKKPDKLWQVAFIYLRLFDFSPEEPDLEPDDFDSLRDELLLTPGFELIDLVERILLPADPDELLTDEAYCTALLLTVDLTGSEYLLLEKLLLRTVLLL